MNHNPLSDYEPNFLASKWKRSLVELREQCQILWESSRPTKKWFSFDDPEPDSRHDLSTSRSDRLVLAYQGFVVIGHFVRAFFPAYIPGKNTHYGSVVYSQEPSECSKVFELGWRIRELRRNNVQPPVGAENLAKIIKDDNSDLASIEIPPSLGMGTNSYLTDVCIQRTRLPLGYIHSRLLPVLIQPEKTANCCILPLRFWSAEFQDIWKSGPPCYPPEPFVERCRKLKIAP